MDRERFDELTLRVAEGSSRRSLMRGLAGGGLAGLLASLGMREAAAETEAEGNRKRRRRRRRRQRQKRQDKNTRTQNNRNNGTEISIGDTNLIADGGLLVDVTCNNADIEIVSLCQTGYCDELTNRCAEFPNSQICGRNDNDQGLVCCINGTRCTDLGCVTRNV